jgi:hypothetical protein
MEYPFEKNDGNFASCATLNDAVSNNFFHDDDSSQFEI